MATDYKVYDRVWVMQLNKPTELIVFAVIDSPTYWKQGVERSYNLVGSMMGAGWGNNSGIQYPEDRVFPSKEACIASLAEA